MKQLVFILVLFSTLSISCKKDSDESCESFLLISKATISGSSSVANGILFNLEAYGGNLCYSFKRLSITKSGDKTYDIRVIANVPCKPRICAEALYQTSPNGTISSLSAGTYTLRFFNDGTLFSSMDVTIN